MCSEGIAATSLAKVLPFSQIAAAGLIPSSLQTAPTTRCDSAQAAGVAGQPGRHRREEQIGDEGRRGQGQDHVAEAPEARPGPRPEPGGDHEDGEEVGQVDGPGGEVVPLQRRGIEEPLLQPDGRHLAAEEELIDADLGQRVGA